MTPSPLPCPRKSARHNQVAQQFLTSLVGIFGLCCTTVEGRAATGHTTSGHKVPSLPAAIHHKPANAPGHKKHPKAVFAKKTENLTVTFHRSARDGGGGMMRQEKAAHTVQTVTKSYIAMKSPTATALDLVKNLPSLNITTPDSAGMEGGQIQSRGLTDLDMALMVDGAPAATARYMAENIDSENLEDVSVTPGSAARDLPVMSAAGGVMTSRTHRAANKMGGEADFSYGTNNLSREFIRFESGKIGNTGIRSFFSFSNAHSRSWMGAGINERKHIDFGLQKDWDNGSFAHLFLSWNNETFTIDNYPTAQEFFTYKHTGQGYGRSAQPGNVNYWKNSQDKWNQLFLTAPLHLVLPRKFSLDLQPYLSFGQGADSSPGGQAGAGQYTFNNSGAAVPAGTNLTKFFLGDELRQVGAVLKLGYDIDRHNHFTVGYWYENSQTIQGYPTSVLRPDGSAASPTKAPYAIGGPTYGQTAGYEIHSLFVQNQSRYLHDRLNINAGFKFVMSNAWNKGWSGNSDNHLAGDRSSNNTTAPLPQLSISYQIDSNNQIYANAEGDYRQPSAADMGWLPASSRMLKNQYSIKEELGYRHHNQYFMMDLALFNYNVSHRIVDQYVGMNSYQPFSIGSQTMRGFDFMIAGRKIYGFSPYASFEYLHATQDSNVFDPGQNLLLHSRGTQAIMAPRIMANFGLTYSYKGFFANGTVHYTGPQSVSIANDQRIPGYVTNSLSLGYHFHSFGFMKSPTFKLNFTNLTGSIVRTGAMGAVYSAHDKSTIYSGSRNASTGYGNAFMLEPRFSMTGTVSTAF